MKNFDELLDGVLREDAAAQPGAGLEGRVMARVREEERLPQGLILRLRSGWRSWLLVSAAACAGIVAVVWYVAAGGVSQPERIASRVPPPTLSAHSVAKPEMGSGGNGHALRDAHLTTPPTNWRGPRLSDDKAVAKMGHPTLVARETTPLPKLDVFPTPAEVDMFPRPVKATAEESQLAALRSEKVVEAIAALHQEQSEPIRIAAIEIAPLQTDGDSGRDR